VGTGRVREPRRGADVPAWLRRIVLRGLAPKARDRHPTMAALLAELARDPGRTRRGAAIAASAVALAVALGLAVGPPWRGGQPACTGAAQRLAGVWDGDLAARVRVAFAATRLPYAEASFRGAAHRLDDYAAAWRRMHGETCEATQRGEQSERALDLRMTCLAQRRTELAALTAMFAAPDAQVVERSVAAAGSLPDLADCADLERLSAPVPPPRDPAARAQIEAVRAQLATAHAYEVAGKYAQALALAERALAPARTTGSRSLEAAALKDIGWLRSLAGAAVGAEQALFDAIVAAETARDAEIEADARIGLASVQATLARYDEGLRSAALASALLSHAHDPRREARLRRIEGRLLSRKGQYTEARARYQSALALAEHGGAADEALIADCLFSLAGAERNRHDYEAALGLYRRALEIDERVLGPDHPAVAVTLADIGDALLEQNQTEAALAAVRRALAIDERALGADHPRTGTALYVLARIHERRGEHDLAEASYRRALAITDREPATNPVSAQIRASLAEVLDSQGRPGEALEEARRALAIYEQLSGPTHDDVASTLRTIGDALVKQGAYGEAVASYRRAVAIFEQVLGPDHLQVAVARTAMSRALGSKGEHEAALAELARAGAIYAKLPGLHWRLGFNHQYAGEELARAGTHGEAIAEFQRALDILAPALGATNRYVSMPLVGLGTSHLALGDPHAALAPLERAVAILEAHPEDKSELAEARFALARAVWDSHGSASRARTLARAARAGFGTASLDRANARAADAWLARRDRRGR
jgi:tetratricopeptide (TPR) repeat protein